MIFTKEEANKYLCGSNFTGIIGVRSVKGINICLFNHSENFALSLVMEVPGYEDKGPIIYWISPYNPFYIFISDDCPSLPDKCKEDINESMKLRWKEIMEQAKISCDYNCGDDYLNCIYRNNRIIPNSPPDYTKLWEG